MLVIHIYFLKECTVEDMISMQSKIYFFVLSNSCIKLNITNSFMFLKITVVASYRLRNSEVIHCLFNVIMS